MFKSKKLTISIIIPIILVIISFYLFFASSGPMMVISTSSDGRYIISSTANKYVILWNLQKKDKKIISRNANVYSAYFIKNSDKFIWQDLHNVVHIQDVNGKEILKFKNFPTYGEAMTSDLKHFFACNENLDLYEDYGNNQKLVVGNGNQGGFEGARKLLNLTLSSDNKFLLTSGTGGDYQPFQFDDDDGITLWDANIKKPIQKFSGNQASTFATLSPEGKYIVSGDEDNLSFIWNADTKKKLLAVAMYFPNMPKDFINSETGNESNGAILAVKFIDNNGHYLRFTTYVPYAILYSVNNPQPIKYFPLTKDPFPSVNDYSRDQSIDTAPAANILVMGEQYSNGIIVYKFDPKTLTLNKVWVGNA